MGKAVFTPVVNAFRFYGDGTESGSSQLAAQDTNYTSATTAVDLQFQLRLRIDETGSSDGATTDDWVLQYNKNGAALWATVPTTSTIGLEMDGSSSLTDTGATTNRGTDSISDPGAGSFVASEQCKSNAEITDFQLTANNFTEAVWGLRISIDECANGDYFEFRLSLNGGLPGLTNNVTPRYTVTKSAVTHQATGSGAGQLDATATGGAIHPGASSAGAGQLDGTATGGVNWAIAGSGAGQLDGAADGTRVQFIDNFVSI